MSFPRLVIAGTHSGVGKTTVSLALMSALTQRGRRVQPFKVGPDYLDPTHHRLATGQISHNLDGWMLDRGVNQRIFLQAAAETDISLIEGMMGLFDGASPIDERGSTAEQAKWLGAPVLLVVDGSAMARSVAALVTGYARFDPSVQVAGVLFNRVNSDGHYQLLKKSVESGSDLTVVGFLRVDSTLTIEERHLGLKVAMEHRSTNIYEKLGQAISETVDLDEVERLASLGGEFPWPETIDHAPPEKKHSRKPAKRNPSVIIALAYDPAFCFYYQENLDLLKAAGGKLITFSPLKDPVLPKADLLYLGGGYPELYGEVLAKNVTMRQAIKRFAQSGHPIYAECGGLMYLTRAIQNLEGQVHDMVGLFPFRAVMKSAFFTLGYREIEVTKPCILGRPGTRARGHEFHYSYLAQEGDPVQVDYACAVVDSKPGTRSPDGLMVENTLALYTHLHFGSQSGLAQALVNSAS